MSRRDLAAAALLALSLSLSGCAETSSSEPAPSSTVVSAPQEAPSGSHYVDLDSIDVRVAVPDGWLVLDPAAGAEDPAIVKAASSVHTEPAAIVDSLEKAGVVKLLPETATDVTGSAVDLRVVERKELPDQEQAEKDIEAIGGSAGTISTVRTELGNGVRIPYVISYGGVPSASELLVIDDGTRIVTINCSMPSIPLVEPLTMLMAATVQES